MKNCPICNRTYSDDTFTFCLNDGALLSAPYDPPAPKPSPYYRTDPPPTEVMPAHPLSTATDLPPTMPAISPEAINPIKSRTKTRNENSEGISGAMIATIILLLVLSVILAVGLSRC